MKLNIFANTLKITLFSLSMAFASSVFAENPTSKWQLVDDDIEMIDNVHYSLYIDPTSINKTPDNIFAEVLVQPDAEEVERLSNHYNDQQLSRAIDGALIDVRNYSVVLNYNVNCSKGLLRPEIAIGYSAPYATGDVVTNSPQDQRPPFAAPRANSFEPALISSVCSKS